MREFLISPSDLENAIKTLQPFISKEETRFYLNGIFFEWKNGDERINLVATDGHKLCVMQLAIDPEEGLQGDIACIVPTDALKTILLMLKGVKILPHITMKIEDTNLKCSLDCMDQKAEFKCYDATFPDYRRVIPDVKPSFSIGLSKEQATEAVKAVSKHKGGEPMEWQLTDANSPIKLVGNDKIVVIMPMRGNFNEIKLGDAA